MKMAHILPFMEHTFYSRLQYTEAWIFLVEKMNHAHKPVTKLVLLTTARDCQMMFFGPPCICTCTAVFPNLL